MAVPEGEYDIPAANPSKYKRRQLIALFIIIGGIAIFGAVAYEIGLPSTQVPAQAVSLDTWQQYGISIKYPSGLQTQYREHHGLSTSSVIGTVYWSWNNGQRFIALSWGAITTPDNMTEDFQVTLHALQANATSVTVVDEGNITMAGAVWQYQTYNANVSGQTVYSTDALCDYPDQRLYEIDFFDASPDAPSTLSSLEYYGNTFAITFNQTDPSSSLWTWQQYGLGIQYPAGLPTNYEAGSNSEAGGVWWIWNNDNSELDLTYLLNLTAGQTVNITAFFQARSIKIGASSANATLTDQGNVAMNGVTWQYQTYSYTQNRTWQLEYCTTAVCQYPNHHLYLIDFFDNSPDTLSSLEYYENTFIG